MATLKHVTADRRYSVSGTCGYISPKANSRSLIHSRKLGYPQDLWISRLSLWMNLCVTWGEACGLPHL